MTHTTIAPGADAVILPPGANFHDAVQEALQVRHPPKARLYHNGRQIAWLPRRPAGWWPISAIIVKEAA